MKVKINSKKNLKKKKKNLKVNLSILVDKKTIEKKMDDKLIELKDKVQLKVSDQEKYHLKLLKINLEKQFMER